MRWIKARTPREIVLVQVVDWRPERTSVAPYRILLLDERGEQLREQVMEFEHDDAAIDHTGALKHRHGIDLWQGERLVARFPPWSPIGR